MNIPFNNDWLFTEDFDGGFENAVTVRLPHTSGEIPYNYIDCTAYQMVCGYRKRFHAPEDCRGFVCCHLDTCCGSIFKFCCSN